MQAVQRQMQCSPDVTSGPSPMDLSRRTIDVGGHTIASIRQVRPSRLFCPLFPAIHNCAFGHKDQCTSSGERMQEQDTVCLYTSLIHDLNLEDRYIILGPIGAGGMGEVFKAKDQHTDRVVAIKILASGMEKSDEATQRFLREAKVLASLQHPNIVNLYAYGVGNNCPYQVIDYLEGGSLATRLAAGPLTIGEFHQVFYHLADAMRYASERGIVHRDIKPANIFLCPEDGVVRPVLLDFGIVRQTSGAETLTATRTVLGSPPYMSPEQCRGEPVDYRSDMYSFGCVMFEALSGTPPYAGETVVDIMFKHMNDPVPVLNALVKGKRTASPLSDLVRQCMDKDPALRPGSFEELGRRISECMDNSNTTTLFVQPVQRPMPWRVLLVALALMIFLPLTVYCLWFRRAPTPMPYQKSPPPLTESEFINVASTTDQISRWKRRYADAPPVEKARLAENIVQLQKDLARYYRNHDQNERAQQYYSELLRYTPLIGELHKEQADIYNNLADVTMIMLHNQKDEAKRTGLWQQALLYSENAEREADSSLTAKAHVNTSISRGLILLEFGRTADALDRFQRAVDTSPGLHKSHSIAGRLTDLAKDIERVIDRTGTSKISHEECIRFLDLHLCMADELEKSDRLYEATDIVRNAEIWLKRAFPQDPVHADPERSSAVSRLRTNFSQSKKPRTPLHIFY